MNSKLKSEYLLEIFSNCPNEVLGEMEGILDENTDTVQDLLSNIMEIYNKSQRQSDLADKRMEISRRITKKFKSLIETAIPFSDLSEKEQHSVESNALIRGILSTASLNRQMPSVTYKEYVCSVAKEIGMKLGDEEIQLLSDQFSMQRIAIVSRHSHIRTEASKRSGWFEIDKSNFHKDEPLHLTYYERAYFEIINILKGIGEQNNAKCRQFREKFKAWGKEKIKNVLQSEMKETAKAYILRKYPESENGKKDIDEYIDVFISDMEQVQRQYSSFILTGEVKKSRENQSCECNENFHFYLHLLYAYVRYYTFPPYKYLALYCLEQIYCGNTLTGILQQHDGYTIFREYVLKMEERYLREAKVPDKNDGRYALAVKEGTTLLITEKEQREKNARSLWKQDRHFRKRLYYIYKMYAVFSQMLFERMEDWVRKEKGLISDMNIYIASILTYLNTQLDCRSEQLWGTILTVPGDPNLIDYNLWFLFRPFIVSPVKARNASSFFGPLESEKSWIKFIYDWKRGTNKTALDEIINDLEKNNLYCCQELIDSIVYQIYKAKDINKGIEKVLDQYVDEISEKLLSSENANLSELTKEINKKIKLKVPSHTSLLQNLFYDLYDQLHYREIQNLLEDYGLSFFTPLWKDSNIQDRIKEIIRDRKNDNWKIKYYFWYLENAAWLPEEAVKKVKGYKEQ